MEFLNKVELKGVVGRVNIADCTTDLKCANFSVITELHDRAHNTIEYTWWNCLAWINKCPNCTEIQKGDKVHVIGRLRQRRYTDQEGNDRTSCEVVVQSVEKIEE